MNLAEGADVRFSPQQLPTTVPASPYVSVGHSVVARIGGGFRRCQIDGLEDGPELSADHRFHVLTGDLGVRDMVPGSPPGIAEQVVGGGGPKGERYADDGTHDDRRHEQEATQPTPEDRSPQTYRLSIGQPDNMQPQDSIARSPSLSPFEGAPDDPADPERDNNEERGESERREALAKARLGLVSGHRDHATHVDLATAPARPSPEPA